MFLLDASGSRSSSRDREQTCRTRRQEGPMKDGLTAETRAAGEDELKVRTSCR